MAGTHFDRFSEDYEATRGGTGRATSVHGQIRDHLVPGNVLDLGAGTGVAAAELVREDRTVVCLDLSVRMLRHARREDRGGMPVAADAHRLPFGAGSFRNALLLHVLHFLSSPRLALRETARVLDADGRVVVVHGAQNIPEDDIGRCLSPLAVLERPRWDTHEGLRNAAAHARLEAVHQGTVTYDVLLSPAQVIDALEAGEAGWAAEASPREREVRLAPVIAALRDLPSGEVPRRQEWRNLMTVLRPAGSA